MKRYTFRWCEWHFDFAPSKLFNGILLWAAYLQSLNVNKIDSLLTFNDCTWSLEMRRRIPAKSNIWPFEKCRFDSFFCCLTTNHLRFYGTLNASRKNSCILPTRDTTPQTNKSNRKLISHCDFDCKIAQQNNCKAATRRLEFNALCARFRMQSCAMFLFLLHIIAVCDGKLNIITKLYFKLYLMQLICFSVSLCVFLSLACLLVCVAAKNCGMQALTIANRGRGKANTKKPLEKKYTRTTIWAQAQKQQTKCYFNWMIAY